MLFQPLKSAGWRAHLKNHEKENCLPASRFPKAKSRNGQKLTDFDEKDLILSLKYDFL